MKTQLLVITNETAESDALFEAVAARDAEVLVVVPALNSRLRHWLSDCDPARLAADRRLGLCVTRLREAGVQAEGWVGDADPLNAIEDALSLYQADEILIATHPHGRSHWLMRDIVVRARQRFDVPVIHVAVQGAERATLCAA